jgi:hypothetical protein
MMAPTINSIVSHASYLKDSTNNISFWKIFEPLSKPIVPEVKKTVHSSLLHEFSIVGPSFKRDLEISIHSAFTIRSINRATNAASDLNNDTSNVPPRAGYPIQKKTNLGSDMGPGTIAAIILLIFLIAFAIIWEIYRRHRKRSEILRRHKEEAQRRRNYQERDAAIRNREWVEINLGSVGVVQDVEFADVDVDGVGQGNKVQNQSRFKKIMSQFPSGWGER